jgi:hypothetical protein
MHGLELAGASQLDAGSKNSPIWFFSGFSTALQDVRL